MPPTQHSRLVSSNQTDIHPRLADTVRRHLASVYRKPYAAHTARAFAELAATIDARAQPLIFDSFCGVGESTRALAERFPSALVIGIDKSAARLARHQRGSTGNYRLLRADVDDFWRLAVDAGWQLARHYLLYPNPWPKSTQLQRRCHGSPLFPTLLQLGGTLELRSNWPLYLDEFARALAIAGHSVQREDFAPDPPITPFERKYQQSGQPLWRLRAPLANAAGGAQPGQSGLE